MGYVLPVGLLISSSVSVSAQYTVRFDQSRYEISPGQTFQAQVLIDPVPAPGLASYGVQLLFNPANASVSDVSAIAVPAALDFNGVRGQGAVKSVAPGLAAVKGTVDFFLNPAQPWSEFLLATFTITDRGVGSYTLVLGFYNTLGPTEQIFVDGLG